MEPACRRTHLLRDRLGKSDHVVMRTLLDLPGARHIDAGTSSNRGRVVSRHHAEFDVGIQSSQLDLEPCAETPLVRPDGAHLRSRVAGYH